MATEWTKQKATEAKRALQDLFNALSLGEQIRRRDDMNAVSEFLDEARRQAPEEEP